MEIRKKALALAFLLALFMLAASIKPAHASGPTIATCSSDATVKYTFYENEIMYVLGSGFPRSSIAPASLPGGTGNFSLQSIMENALSVAKAMFAGPLSRSYAIYVVYDLDNWTDKMLIPPRIPGTEEQVSIDASGNLQPTLIWNAPLTPGGYDIVIDLNNNGRYDIGTDVLQKARIDACPTQHYGVFVLPLPEYWSGTILGLTSFFSALGLFGLIKKRRAAKPDHGTTRQPH